MADFKFYTGQQGGNTLADLARFVMPSDKDMIQNAGTGASPFGFGQGFGSPTNGMLSGASDAAGAPAAGAPGGGSGLMGDWYPGKDYSSAAQPGGSYNPYHGVNWGDPAVYNATPLGQSISNQFGGAYDPNTNYGDPAYYQGPAGQAALASPGIQALGAGDSDVAGALAMAQNAGTYVPGSYGSAAQPGGSYNPYAGVDWNNPANQPAAGDILGGLGIGATPTTVPAALGAPSSPSAFPGAASYGGQNFDLKSLFGGASGFPGMTGLFGGGT